MIRLAVDNVAPLPIGNLRDIPGMIRRFADDLEGGKHGDLHRAVLIIQRDDNSMALFGWGENSTDLELMGLFEAAKLRVFADHSIEDEE
jgi:hypothetical protein